MKLRFLAVTGAVLLCAGGLFAQSVSPAPLAGQGTVLPPSASTLPPLAPDGEAAPACSDGGGPWGCLDHASPYPYQFWASADFLLWRIRGASLPTTAAPQVAGVVGVTTFNNLVNPTTTMLPVFVTQNAGLPVNDSQARGDHVGGRFTVGYWFDPGQNCGIEVGGFYLQPRTSSFTSTSNNASGGNLFTVGTGLASTVTSPPFPASAAGSLPVVFLGQANSSAAVSSTTNLWGTEANVDVTGVFFGPVRVGGLLGIRQLELRDDLALSTSEMVSLTPQATSPLFPVVVNNGNALLPFSTLDRISTRNTFYGGQAGLDVEAPCGCFFLRARGKLAVGDMHEAANVLGLTTTGGSVLNGGLLSSPTDFGRHVRDRIAVIPETSIKLGVFLCSHLTAYVGYDALYISDVARPGEQTRLGSSQTSVTVAGTSSQTSLSQPGFQFQGNHLWVQGFDFGMEFRY